MKINRSIIGIYIALSAFLILFEGLNLFLKVKYGGPEKTFIFTVGVIPSSFSLILSGFFDLKIIVCFLILSMIALWLLMIIIRFQMNKRVKPNLILNSFFTTIIITILYFLYRMLEVVNSDIEFLYYYFGEVMIDTILLMIIFSLISIPLTYFLINTNPIAEKEKI